MKLLRAVSVCALLAAPAGHAVESNASRFALTRLEPSERGSRFFSLETLDWRKDGLPTFGLVFDYSYKPLVIYEETDSGLKELTAVVRNFAVGHVGGSINLGEQVRLGLDVPVLLYGDGSQGQVGLVTYLAPQRSGLGDLRVSGDWRFLGTEKDAARLGLGLRLFIPTGDPGAFVGDGALRATVQVQAAGEIWEQLAWSARLGTQLRAREVLYAGNQVGHEVQIAVGLGWKGLDGRLLIGPELFGSMTYNQAFSRGSSALEVLLGAHFDLSRQWRAGLGIGRGVTVALGSPSVRGLLTLEWAPPIEGDGSCDAARAQDRLAAQQREEAQQAAQREREAELRRAAQAAAESAAAEQAAKAAAAAAAEAKANADDDGDGIANRNDACPDQSGPANADKAKNGCPVGAVVGGQLVLELVRFSFGSDVILPESDALLTKVVAAIGKLPADYRFRVEGHTDNAGPASYNRDLSQRRAQAVVAWLGKHGVDAKRFEAVGFGPERPVAANDTEANRLLNRRVEIHVVNLEVKP